MIKEKYVFKGNFCIYKGFMDVGMKEKPQNVHLKLFFRHVLDRFILRERNDLTCLTRIVF